MIQNHLHDPIWQEKLKDEFNKPYFLSLEDFLAKNYECNLVYPPQQNIFAALNLTPLEETKAVILGQDPYHQPGQAHGLSFSVPQGVKPPPSLKNILVELSKCFKTLQPKSGDLTPWAKKGVLLLNTVLTVEAGKPNSHQQKGWEVFTDKIIQIINGEKTGVIFVLWGSQAQKKGPLIDGHKNLILKAPHPSPLSSYRGFFGSEPFTKINNYLESRGEKTIDWTL